MSKVIAIVQARMGSVRLPNKVMKCIKGVPIIELLLSRLRRATEINQIVLATSVAPNNQPLVDHVSRLGITCERGSENDVLERYVQVAEKHGADVIVRITGDCPLLDAALVDECVRGLRRTKVDYFSNVAPPSFPDGLDVEVLTMNALQRAMKESAAPFDHEHVTSFVRESGLFKTAVLRNVDDLSALRWTVDGIEDFEVVTNVFEHFAGDIYFGWREVLELQQTKPELFLANRHIKRNEGASMNAGQKLWLHAKSVIPGGNMLLSKRAEMFLPDHWPAYFSKTSGCRVWDLDGREYVDMSIMGVGTNTLGYSHPEVDDAVMKAVRDGNMSTFNCAEEVYLADKLLAIHPWAEMVKLARTGGEANAIAVRIARAASGKDKVAICGYHGWHDWYLSANLGNDKSLDGHLLPGLAPNGVPRNLKGSVFTFKYNNYDELESLVEAEDIGVIKMEVVRNFDSEDGFLKKVRKLASERNVILIFDECTSGFRETFGGLHKKYDVEPDIAIFGKALGNGYGITAIVGRRRIMQAAQSTFISSTFWTERIGPTAALKTLEVMERVRSWDKITKTGKDIRQRWELLANKYSLQITSWGLPALAGFSFQSPNAVAYKTLLTQEMIKIGYLAGNCVYVCTEHTPEIVDNYFEALEPLFALIKECEDGRAVESLLKGPVCHSGFKRLN